MKVTLYVREHSTRHCRNAKPEQTYPMGTIWVLRYVSTWVTLPPNLNSIEAVAAKIRKEIALLTGKETTVSKPKQKKDAGTLDTLIDVYLTTGRAAEKEWRTHTLQCYPALLDSSASGVRTKPSTPMVRTRGCDPKHTRAVP